MAGHSKFKNIMYRKGAQDAKRSKLFSKLSKEITVAAKMGGTDAEANSRLRLAIQNARAQSMPKDNIERAIKKSEAGDAANFENVRYEGYGPSGIAVIVEALTDNRNRTASSVRSTFSKSGGALGETGSVSFMFDKVGEIGFSADVGDADTMLEAAIEAGADDVQSDEDGHIVTTEFGSLGEVAKALEDALSTPQSVNVVWKPQTATEVDLETAQKIMRLVSTLEDDEDVQDVFTNFAASDDVMAALTDG